LFVSAGVAAPARALFAAARAAASETCSLTMAEARALVAVSAGAAAPRAGKERAKSSSLRKSVGAVASVFRRSGGREVVVLGGRL